MFVSNYDAMQVLVNAGADVNQRFGEDKRAFIYEATCNNDPAMIKFLVQACEADTDLFITENRILTTNALQVSYLNNIFTCNTI